MDWTDAAVARLRDQHEAGWTASQSADFFGCSRNAVIGKWHRLGLSKPIKVRSPNRPARVSNPVTDGPAGAAVRKINRRSPLPSVNPVPVEPVSNPYTFACTDAAAKPLGVRLVDLRDEHCRYPYDVPPDKREGVGPYVFCGKKIAQKSYCAVHALLCLQPITTPVKKAARV